MKIRATNKLFPCGYVGQEPKLFDKVCKASISTARIWTDKKGAAHEETDCVQVTILKAKGTKWFAENVRKGDPVFCEVRVRQNSFKNKDGETIYTTEVIATLFDSLKQQPTDNGAWEQSSHFRRGRYMSTFVDFIEIFSFYMSMV
jgi:single-strand DNA-binding protein